MRPAAASAGHDPHDLVLVLEVHGQRGGAAALGLQERRDLVDHARVAIDHHHVGALLGQPCCGHLPDAPGPAGHEDDPAVQPRQLRDRSVRVGGGPGHGASSESEWSVRATSRSTRVSMSTAVVGATSTARTVPS